VCFETVYFFYVKLIIYIEFKKKLTIIHSQRLKKYSRDIYDPRTRFGHG